MSGVAFIMRLLGFNAAGAAADTEGEDRNRVLEHSNDFIQTNDDTSIPPRVNISLRNPAPTITYSDAAPQAVGTTAAGVAATSSRGDHVHAHGSQLGGSLHALAVAGVSHGFISDAWQAVLEALNVSPPNHASRHTNGADQIANASGGGAGLLTAADFTKLAVATDAATASTLIIRDAAGRAKVVAPSGSTDIDTLGARDTAIAAALAAITKYHLYHWAYSAGTSGAGPTTPAYIWQGPSPSNAAGAFVRRYPVVVKMKPLSITIYPPTGGVPTSAVLRFELYSGNVATGDFVEFNNNLAVQTTTAFPLQGTLNAGVDVDLRVNVKSGSTVSVAMQATTFTVLFQEVP